jgi:hypothetical protein
VVTGTGAADASLRPYLSSMLTTPTAGGANSDALARKYSSRSPWKSR